MRARGTVSIDLVRLLVLYSASKGIEAPRALCVRGFGPSFAGADERVPFATYSGALAELAHLSGDPCFGLHLGAWAWRFASNHLVLAVVANSPNLGEALRRLVRYHALLADAVDPSLVRSGKHVVIRLGSPRSFPIGRDVTDAIVAALVGVVRLLSVSPPIVEVMLRHDVPGTPGEHERVLRTPVRFGAKEDGLRIEAASLSQPLLLSDRQLLAVLERRASRRLALLDETSFGRRVQRAVEGSLLESGALPTLAAVARLLATSRRTLQGRLRSESTSFRRISDGARRALAEELLADRDLTLAEVTFMLGFAEQSAFTHAFRRWTGLTPGSFRRRRPAASQRR